MTTDKDTSPQQPKPRGWKDEHPLFWVKERSNGCHYKCKTCGKETHGTYGDRHRYMHLATCALLTK